jgi:hypothetical protein
MRLKGFVVISVLVFGLGGFLLYRFLTPPSNLRVGKAASTGSVYDEIVFVDSRSFTYKRILALCEQVLRDKSASYRLIRLTAGVSEFDVLPLVKSETIAYFDPARLNTKWRDSANVAQMIYRDGSAIVRIKTGKQVVYKQLRGHNDPSEIDLVDVHYVLRSFATDGKNSGLEWARFCVTANPLPTLEQAKALVRELQAFSHVSLTVRTDSFFREYEGPYADIFNPPYPSFTEDDYYQTPQITCTDVPELRHPPSPETCVVGPPKRWPRGFAY